MVEYYNCVINERLTDGVITLVGYGFIIKSV